MVRNLWRRLTGRREVYEADRRLGGLQTRIDLAEGWKEDLDARDFNEVIRMKEKNEEN